MATCYEYHGKSLYIVDIVKSNSQMHASAFQTANDGRGGDQCGTGSEGSNS